MANQTNWTPIIMIVFVIAFIVLAQKGFFKPQTVVQLNQTIIEKLENPVNLPGVSCSLSLDKRTIIAGDLVTATITDGKNTYCEGYGKMVGTNDWRRVEEGYTDITGRAVYSENFYVVGDFIWAAICDSNGNGFLDTNDCVTNYAYLTVNPAPVGDCTDSDGKNKMTPGYVTDSGLYYYDNCEGNSVREYGCLDGHVTNWLLPCDLGYICYETRGGDYCKLDEGYEVGDIIGGHSDSGTMPSSGGLGYEFHDLLGVTLGGTHHLGARISTNWDYVDQSKCYGYVIQEGLEWIFMDSDSVEWQVIDNTPQSHSVTLCPLNWDGSNLWYLEFFRTQNIPGCDITYEWEVEIYVCD